MPSISRPARMPVPTWRARESVRGATPHAPFRRALSPIAAGALAFGLAPGPVHSQAFDERWYVGIGGGAARLRPDAESAAFDAGGEATASGTLFVGRDLDERTSVQLQLHALGETTLEREESPAGGDETVAYAGADASVLYRFLDTRDRAPRGTVFGASLYGRVGLGFMRRDTDAALGNDADVAFGAGAGVELHLTPALALRAEGIFHDRDASSASLSLVARLDGRRRLPPPPRPVPRTPVPSGAPTSPGAIDAPEGTSAALTAPAGAGTARARRAPVPLAPADADADGVADHLDACPSSAHGFPVRRNGCALLDGVLSGVRFIAGTAVLASGSSEQLDLLAELLADYPDARVRLFAHTDDAGSVRDQSILTRARLRTLGIYLVHEGGVRANRLVPRSFGGTRPLYDNRTDEGRAGNNRVEVFEKAS